VRPSRDRAAGSASWPRCANATAPAKASWRAVDPFQAADGKTVFIGITTDNHWRSFCTGFGVEELLSDPSLKTTPLKFFPDIGHLSRLASL
jgi:crotonobetainyl-CoA:carnitine CoA-transferase CaiB-like acyl-CoA transferase